MPPDDPTPLGDAMTHRFPQQKIPEPEPGSIETREPAAQASDITRRPSLPEHPQSMPADLAQEEEKSAGGTVRADKGKPPGKQRG